MFLKPRSQNDPVCKMIEGLESLDSLESLDVFQSNQTEYVGNHVAVAISSSLSLLFSGLMIILYLSRSKLRQASRGYLVMINVCDFVASICFFCSSFDLSLLRVDLIRKIEVGKVFAQSELLGLPYPILLSWKFLLDGVQFSACV